MAAAGTGLPNQRGPIASTVVDTAGYGAGEAAAADGFARAAEGIGRLMNVVEPAAQQEAKAIADQKAAAGEFEQRILLTGADAAYNDAMRTGTLARLSNAADADLDSLRTQHLLDPDGFQRATDEMRAASLRASVPGALAVDWANDFDRRRNQRLGVIRNARAAADLQEAKGGLTTRIDNLITETINAGTGGTLAEVLGDSQVQANLQQITSGIDELANNPAFGVSQEEADAKRDEAIQRIKAGAVSRWAVDTLRRDGSDAALAGLQGLLTDESVGDLTTRQLVFTTAREAVNQELSLTNQRRAQADSERSAALQDLGRQIDEDVARVELTGEGSALTMDQVRAVGGNAMVSQWLKRRADAQDFHGLVGALPLNDPDAAAAQIAQAARTRTFEQALAPVADEGDLATIANAIAQVESGNRDGLVSRDPDGAGPAGGGAYGRMQVLPDTARRIAGQLGLPYDQNRLRNDADYNRRIGTAYLSELMTRYNGDSFLAITAYHAGEGNVDGWLRSVGDPRTGRMSREQWLEGVEGRGNPRSAEYPRKVLAALNAGRAGAAWDSYAGRRRAAAADPAGSVATDFAVRAASERWRAQPTSTTAAEAFVEASMAAQERSGIAQGNRRSLPNASLVIYANELNRFATANDTAGFQGYADGLVRRFGRHGERVLQDALEVRGDARFAAQIAARATAVGSAGQRPTRQDVERSGTANRTSRMGQAATGNGQGAAGMSDAELMAALGSSPVGD